MSFNLDSRKDCERLAALICALQAEGVCFQLTRGECSGGGYTQVATLTFES